MSALSLLGHIEGFPAVSQLQLNNPEYNIKKYIAHVAMYFKIYLIVYLYFTAWSGFRI
ncbi:hypothetical protein KCTCHS21_02660 [Cohnella abietis]|uniref:Uncharacterized protein n=1 Tax=Cohnella abietis TaxID=2507935 RepID=A0A3T1CYC9_9BACL|nr:hypothetical protein KCTCHS21_02660 [Cohnella abietis]